MSQSRWEKNLCSRRSSLADSEAHHCPSLPYFLPVIQHFQQSSLSVRLSVALVQTISAFSMATAVIHRALSWCYINLTRPSRETESSSNSTDFSVGTENLDLLELWGNEVHRVWSTIMQKWISHIFQGHVDLVFCSVWFLWTAHESTLQMPNAWCEVSKMNRGNSCTYHQKVVQTREAIMLFDVCAKHWVATVARDSERQINRYFLDSMQIRRIERQIQTIVSSSSWFPRFPVHSFPTAISSHL